MIYIKKEDKIDISNRILKLKHKPLIEIRSAIVSELLHLRAIEIMKLLKLPNKQYEYSEEYTKYVKFFIKQIPFIIEDTFECPLNQFYLSASNFIDDSVFNYSESELLDLLKKKKISMDELSKDVLDRIYDNSTGLQIIEMKKKGERFVKQKPEDEDLFYPFIHYTDLFSESYQSIIGGYYVFFKINFPKDIYVTNKSYLDEENISNYNLKRKKITHPNSFIENDEITHSFFEVIMNLENGIILEIIKNFDFLKMYKLRENDFSQISTFIEFPKNNSAYTSSDNSIKELIAHFNYEFLESELKSTKLEINGMKTLTNSKFFKDLAKETKNKFVLQKKKDTNMFNYTNKIKGTQSRKQHIFRNEGDSWLIKFNGIEKHIGCLQGMKYINLCLHNPQRLYPYKVLADKMEIKVDNVSVITDIILLKRDLELLEDEHVRISTVEIDGSTISAEAEVELQKIEEAIKIKENEIKKYNCKTKYESNNTLEDKVKRNVQKNIRTAKKRIKKKFPEFYQHLNTYLKIFNGVLYDSLIQWE